MADVLHRRRTASFRRTLDLSGKHFFLEEFQRAVEVASCDQRVGEHGFGYRRGDRISDLLVKSDRGSLCLDCRPNIARADEKSGLETCRHGASLWTVMEERAPFELTVRVERPAELIPYLERGSHEHQRVALPDADLDRKTCLERIQHVVQA
jgi:hypothetical protein